MEVFERLDDICRSEKYFTATLLGYLLLHDNLRGVRIFVKYLFDKGLATSSFSQAKPDLHLTGVDISDDDIEIITELNLLRDHEHYFKHVTQDVAKQSVPDLVIRYGQLLLVIEAKFFIVPSMIKLTRKIKYQRAVIDHIGHLYNGKLLRYAHIYLAHEPIRPSEYGFNASITWNDIAVFANDLLGQDHYVTVRLQRACQRWDRYGQPRQEISVETQALPLIRAISANVAQSPDVVPGYVTLNRIHRGSFSVRVFSRDSRSRDGVSLFYQDKNHRNRKCIALAIPSHLIRHFSDTALLQEYQEFVKSFGITKSIRDSHIELLETTLEARCEELVGFVRRFAVANGDETERAQS